MNMRFEPARGLSGEVRAPADKSISHRAAILGAMASEPVRIERYLLAADTRSTLAAVQSLGALVEVRGDDVVVRGTGLREAREPQEAIDVGNAGTLLRLLPGWLAAQEGRSFTLDGDESIRRRPVDRIAEPLRRDGGRPERARGTLPAAAGERCAGCTRSTYELTVASAQVKSCILLAALAADGQTTVRRARAQPRPHRADAARGRRHDPRDGRQRSSWSTPTSCCSTAFACPATRARRRSWSPPACSCPGRGCCSATSASTGRAPAFCGSCGGCAGSCSATSRTSTASSPPSEPVSDLDVAHGALEGTVVEADEVPAGDRRAAAGGAARLLRRGRDGRARRAGAARQGVRPDRGRRRGSARARRRYRGDRRRLRGARRRGPARRRDRRPRRPSHGDDGRRRRTRLAGGRRGARHGGGRGLLPGVRRGPRRLA